jgi:hypothetical protein
MSQYYRSILKNRNMKFSLGDWQGVKGCYETYQRVYVKSEDTNGKS